MAKYKIELHGCDNSTIFEMELAQEEAYLVESIAEKSYEVSTYACMPIMHLTKLKEN